jgi:putative membrane protein
VRRRSSPLIVTVLGLGLLPWAHTACAHVGESVVPSGLRDAWSLDPWLLVPLVAAAVIYSIGLARMWHRAGMARGVGALEAAAYALGLAALALALVWPLDALGEWSLAAHMAQHMLLVSVAAPLLWLGRPGAAALAALPRRHVPRVARGLRGGPAKIARALRLPIAATLAALAQAGVMWGWHAPAAMQSALTHDAVHYAMHASFLLAGLIFWWAVLASLREPTLGAGAAAVALLGTMMQMGWLGALLTFAPSARYPYYVEHAPMIGLDPLADQQLAGLLMWVPSCVPYLVGAVVLLVVWMRRLERRDAAAEARGGAWQRGRGGHDRARHAEARSGG